MRQTRKKFESWLGMAIFVCILSLQGIQLKASEMEFQENASEVILNSLKNQSKHSFLRRLYTQLLFMPAWVHEKGLSSTAKEFFKVIKNEGTLNIHGKLFQDTLVLEQKAKELYEKKGTLAQKVDLEFKISQLYEGYTNYAYFGSINWGAFNARIANLMVNDVSTEWVLHRPQADPIAMVERAALGGSLAKQLKAVTPTAYRYKALQKELKRYMNIRVMGGWPTVVLGGKLKAGKSDEGVMALRERLRITGDYKPCKEGAPEDVIYDVCLQKAVKHFQSRNGLATDGVIGAGTLRVLNKSVDDRITTIRLNLDRIKWLAKRDAKRHIIINIPSFKLYFEEKGKLIQTMRVVTGKPNHPTPIFSDTVEYIVLNPYWNVPKSIIQKEFVPKLIRNSNAMAKKNIEIRRGWGKNAKVVNPKEVNWRNYVEGTPMPFHFAQLPGKKNALGKVKFLFPNKFAVYMHDTPSKSLFKRSKRAFSHGCIRLQKPRELLKTFSTFNSNIDFKKAQAVLKGKDKKHIVLKEKVPVDVTYLTAWVDYDGKLQFRNDIYHYDAMQLKSFRKW